MSNEPKISSPIDRVRAVTEEIEKQGEISHNKLLEIIVEKRGLMAKKTFEKTIKSMLDGKLVDYRKEKNFKIYYIESQSSGQMSELEKWIKENEKKPLTISKDFTNKTLIDKATEVKFLFSIYETAVSTNTVWFSVGERPKKTYVEVSNLMDRFLKMNMTIWKNDKDFKYLMAELMASRIQTSPVFAAIKKLTEEWTENKL